MTDKILIEVKDFLEWAVNNSHETYETIASRASPLLPKLKEYLAEEMMPDAEQVESARFYHDSTLRPKIACSTANHHKTIQFCLTVVAMAMQEVLSDRVQNEGTKAIVNGMPASGAQDCFKTMFREICKEAVLDDNLL